MSHFRCSDPNISRWLSRVSLTEKVVREKNIRDGHETRGHVTPGHVTPVLKDSFSCIPVYISYEGTMHASEHYPKRRAIIHGHVWSHETIRACHLSGM